MNQGVDGASSSSSVRPVGFGGVQMMMRQLASVSENFAHGSLDDAAWNLWSSQHTSIPSIPSSASIRLNRNAAGQRIRNASPSVNNMSELLAMVDRVREVLPHIPDELIVQVFSLFLLHSYFPETPEVIDFFFCIYCAGFAEKQQHQYYCE